MPSIAIFHCTFTKEQEIKEHLTKLTGYTVIDDQYMIEETSKQFSINPKKLHKALFSKTSVFNKFTFERERNLAHIKLVLAEMLTQPKCLYFGFTSSLIPPKVSHVLKILLADTKEARTERAVNDGMLLKDAEKQIKDDDISAFNWTDFLFNCEPWDKKLYDIVIPVSQKTPSEIAHFIAEQCAQGTLLETEASKQAIADMTLANQLELTLLQRGHKVDLEIDATHIHLKVNKSVLNFNALRSELQDIVAPIAPSYDIEVHMGENYPDSIYRDQVFQLPPKVLLVDDEKDFVLTLSERLLSRNVGAYTVYDGSEALNFLRDDKPDVMVLDLKMPGIDGLEVLKQTKEKNPDIEIIILTGHGSEEDKRNCLKLGAFAYLQKPTDIQTLSATIHDAHKKMTTAETR